MVVVHLGPNFQGQVCRVGQGSCRGFNRASRRPHGFGTARSTRKIAWPARCCSIRGTIVAYDQFYSTIGVSAEEVGVTYIYILARSLGFATILGGILALIYYWFSGALPVLASFLPPELREAHPWLKIWSWLTSDRGNRIPTRLWLTLLAMYLALGVIWDSILHRVVVHAFPGDLIGRL